MEYGEAQVFPKYVFSKNVKDRGESIFSLFTIVIEEDNFRFVRVNLLPREMAINIEIVDNGGAIDIISSDYQGKIIKKRDKKFYGFIC